MGISKNIIKMFINNTTSGCAPGIEGQGILKGGKGQEITLTTSCLKSKHKRA